LRHEAEEVNCLVCHDGSVSDKDIATEIAKTSAHNPRLTTGVHDPMETLGNLEDHVECADCHNPHRSTGGTAAAPAVRPSMQGVSGVSASRLALEEARYEYEVCFKCHAGSNMARFERVNRVLGSNDQSEEFATVNQSFHPVESPGRNTVVPSLKQSLTVSSMIYCTDCHGSDDEGTAGPHGSRHRSMLRANHDTLDGTTEGPQSYELCYSCHNRESILGNESFSEHYRHVVEEHTPCSVCHDPHGVRQNTHLINFDRDVVEAVDPNSVPIYEDRGITRGSCTLRCHGQTHNDERYPED
ncbi:MAG: hypothetical protein IT442_16355, partial [Phycisphaeraceae bacterium]|nr:hypothetical protein [Phycisphaeraceae bacterium]